MKRTTKLVVSLVVVGISGAAMANRMPPNSYLMKTEDSVQGIIRQIKTNRTVSDRYQRHFGMTQPEVIQYVGTLRLTRLPAKGLWTVYNVPQSGELRSRVLNLPKGTKIFVDWQGKPVLQWICGNPMTRGPKDSSSMNEVVASVASIPVEPMIEMTPTVEPSTEVPITSEILPPPTPELQVEIQPEPETPVVVTRKRSDAAGLLGLLLVGAAVKTFEDKKCHDQPVPEPMTMVVMGSALAGLALRRKKS